MSALLEQFRTEHHWWDEYAKQESEHERQRTFFADLEAQAEKRRKLREEAIERIGWTGGLDE